MKRLLLLAGLVALAITAIAPGLEFAGRLEPAATKRWLLGAAVLWFAAALARDRVPTPTAPGA